jgi:hypothetical protein
MSSKVWNGGFKSSDLHGVDIWFADRVLPVDISLARYHKILFVIVLATLISFCHEVVRVRNGEPYRSSLLDYLSFSSINHWASNFRNLFKPISPSFFAGVWSSCNNYRQLYNVTVLKYEMTTISAYQLSSWNPTQSDWNLQQCAIAVTVVVIVAAQKAFICRVNPLAL